jgi:hypothetical protein
MAHFRALHWSGDARPPGGIRTAPRKTEQHAPISRISAFLRTQSGSATGGVQITFYSLGWQGPAVEAPGSIDLRVSRNKNHHHCRGSQSRMEIDLMVHPPPGRGTAMLRQLWLVGR